MLCYIYKIVNQVTQEKYVGQTTNFSRRKQNHTSALKNNTHPNPKLQNAWNKYGEQNFYWEVEKFDLSKEELDQLERETILKEQSFSNGYNLTGGGTGGNTRFHRIINFEQFCFIYAGNKKYEGMTNLTANYIGCDSSTISAIKREISYDDYREQFHLLSKEEQEKYLDDFVQVFKLNEKDPPKKSIPLTEDQVVDFLCLISCYGKGAEIAFLRSLGRAKGLGHHLKTDPNYFRGSKILYNNLTSEEVLLRAEKVYEAYQIQNQLTYKLAKRKQILRVNCAL